MIENELSVEQSSMKIISISFKDCFKIEEYTFNIKFF